MAHRQGVLLYTSPCLKVVTHDGSYVSGVEQLLIIFDVLLIKFETLNCVLIGDLNARNRAPANGAGRFLSRYFAESNLTVYCSEVATHGNHNLTYRKVESPNLDVKAVEKFQVIML